MSWKTTVVWTCDRCEEQVQNSDDRNWQPSDWAQVIEVVPPSGSVNYLGVPRAQLCPDCRRELRDWLEMRNQ